MKKQVALVPIVLLSISLAVVQGCSEEPTAKANQTPTCMVSDRVTFLKSFVIEDKTYFLYERRGGFADKMSYLEFYDVKPEFDQCGESTIERISQVPVDDLGNNPVRIIIKDMLIDIEYGDTPYSSPDLAALPVEVQ